MGVLPSVLHHGAWFRAWFKVVPTGSTILYGQYCLEVSMIVPGSVPGSGWFRMVLEGENMDKLNTCTISPGVPMTVSGFVPGSAWFRLVLQGRNTDKLNTCLSSLNPQEVIWAWTETELRKHEKKNGSVPTFKRRVSDPCKQYLNNTALIPSMSGRIAECVTRRGANVGK